MTYTAVVSHQNRASGRFAAAIEDHGWIVADPNSPDEVQVNDELVGIARDHGDQVVWNRTQHQKVTIYVEAFDAGPDARDALLR